ncbi:LacI family DNA-binding transcriptional regulator [Halobacillus karajensis]|uniref:Glucose-resistance amylase regulator n=1 Tax=Halobacillus karajensis TaxID=195088 RepID=A0A024P0Y3_9BACI|nr:LacI family DNA-binding transcriptional regulator [Halobacillus karajensis]CDQ19347.1 Glucose-resistance amylase regulator [Halobacillus karajensis]CDQ21810.1 Glucose-resistance amylase regulator [Halobacillus karajensis]CDQ27650.1 Glucose-resistance amylase regulator [Halobacillus karajensis]
MRLTVHDIARVANVSQATVSKVLNNYSGVKESTRKKVTDAIEELKFTPDSVARSMVTNKTNTLGLIVGDISNPFFAESAKIIIGKAQEKGYDVIISNTDHDDENLENAIQTLISKRVDGIIISSISRSSMRIKKLHENGFPIVLYNSRVEGDSSNSVVLDNYRGAVLAVDHLVDLGHQDIAFIAGPTKYLTTYERYLGYREALEKHGLDLNKAHVYDGEYDYRKVYDFSYNLLSSPDRPTSFFATSDQMALAVMDAAASRKISIPQELSVVGFDNMSISANAYIGLTTVSQQKENMAELALKKLISLIEKTESDAISIQLSLKPELIVRKTTSTPYKE